jgi:hypothetical protein
MYLDVFLRFAGLSAAIALVVIFNRMKEGGREINSLS